MRVGFKVTYMLNDIEEVTYIESLDTKQAYEEFLITKGATNITVATEPTTIPPKEQNKHGHQRSSSHR